MNRYNMKKNKNASPLTYISSDYIQAANRLKGKTSRERIVAYVESYDDIFFWRMILSEFENEKRYFEVMLPTRGHLTKGKKQALVSLMKNGGGSHMIACVDADYDFLMQGHTPLSQFMLENPYVIHTYVYAIENFQCYAPSLHNVCVMATLNDHTIFDFVEFLSEYSKAVFPLFVWSVMLYRTGGYPQFTITDFNAIVGIRHGRLQDVPSAIEKVRHKVRVKLQELQRKIPGMKEEYLRTKADILALGIQPETTYMYVQGHHLFDNVVVPTMQTVCDELRREREYEIKKNARHIIQMQNEMSAYNNAQSDIAQMLKKNQGYMHSPLYRKVRADIENALSQSEKPQEEQSAIHSHAASMPTETGN